MVVGLLAPIVSVSKSSFVHWNHLQFRQILRKCAKIWCVLWSSSVHIRHCVAAPHLPSTVRWHSGTIHRRMAVPMNAMFHCYHCHCCCHRYPRLYLDFHLYYFAPTNRDWKPMNYSVAMRFLIVQQLYDCHRLAPPVCPYSNTDTVFFD